MQKHLLATVMLLTSFAGLAASAGTNRDTSGSARQASAVAGDKASFEFSWPYVGSYVTDIGGVLGSPGSWRMPQWTGVLLAAETAALLYSQDTWVRDWAQGNRTAATNTVSAIVKPFGGGYYTIPLCGLLYGYGHFYGNVQSRKAGLLGLEAMAITAVFTETTKYLLHRHRPSSGDPWNTWDGPILSTENASFPSGHSSSAFAAAAVIASVYNDKPWIPPIAYALAALTALSRVNDNAHWASDAFTGSILGYAIGKTVVRLHSQPKDSRISVGLVPYGSGAGVKLSYGF